MRVVAVGQGKLLLPVEVERLVEGVNARRDKLLAIVVARKGAEVASPRGPVGAEDAKHLAAAAFGFVFVMMPKRALATTKTKRSIGVCLRPEGEASTAASRRGPERRQSRPRSPKSPLGAT